MNGGELESAGLYFTAIVNDAGGLDTAQATAALDRIEAWRPRWKETTQ